MDKHLRNLIGIGATAVVLLAVAKFVQSDLYLRSAVVLPAGVKLGVWLEQFENLAGIAIGSSFLASIAWYIYGQWIHKTDDWRLRLGREFWLLFALMPLAGVLIAIAMTPPVDGSALVIYLFYTIDAFACYYLATVLFSPSAVKYLPPGAVKIRKRW